MIRFMQKGDWFVIRLIAMYSETDSVKSKDASFVVTLVLTYSEKNSAKFKDASLSCWTASFSGKSLRNICLRPETAHL